VEDGEVEVGEKGSLEEEIRRAGGGAAGNARREAVKGKKGPRRMGAGPISAKQAESSQEEDDSIRCRSSQICEGVDACSRSEDKALACMTDWSERANAVREAAKWAWKVRIPPLLCCQLVCRLENMYRHISSCPALSLFSVCLLLTQRQFVFHVVMRGVTCLAQGYKESAWGQDELHPLSRTSGSWFDLGLTLVDSLDTLLLMGMKEEFKEAEQWVEQSLRCPSPPV
jgi:hypothetical protein